MLLLLLATDRALALAAASARLLASYCAVDSPGLLGVVAGLAVAAVLALIA